MANLPDFYMLDGWLKEENAKAIFGAAVKEAGRPGRNSAPTNAITPEVEFQRNACSDFVIRQQRGADNDTTMVLGGFATLRKSKSSNVFSLLKGKMLYRTSITQQDTFWEQLLARMSDYDHKRILGWVRDRRMGRRKYAVCLVVGLLACEDAVVVNSMQEARDFEARGQARIGTIATMLGAGLPFNLGGLGDAELGHTRSAGDASYFRANFKGIQICGLELREIVPSRKGLQLKDDGPMRLGEEDGDISLSPGVSDEAWEIIEGSTADSDEDSDAYDSGQE